jgi:hypothetical protein
MRVELDHFFILTDVGAPDEADRLLRFGLTEGPPNRHPGQGTACRRFVFGNAFLELLWVTNPAEAQSSLVSRTALWERWSRRSRGASPFGICLRPAQQGAGETPFPAWEYRPPYLPDRLAIHMGANSEVVTEPLLFYITFGRRPGESFGRPPNDAAGLRAVTGLRLSGPQREAASASLCALEDHCPWLGVVDGGEYLMEVSFDEEADNQAADLRPHLPLILRW